ncbi:hypothetical protein [Sphingobium aquiterrae]|uniref:hypothetical protein n=1 Tax=Sphingobium aquiterrae TaxID=2038656 RepID=UPI003019F5BC
MMMFFAEAAMVLGALSASAFQPHYEEARRCLFTGRYIAETDITGTLAKKNNQFGRQVFDRYMPIFAFEAFKLGKTEAEIEFEANIGSRRFVMTTLDEINGLALKARIGRYEKLLSEVVECNRVPTLQLLPGNE